MGPELSIKLDLPVQVLHGGKFGLTEYCLYNARQNPSRATHTLSQRLPDFAKIFCV